jgi:asparagine synthase (glutamine-hydrolysing)
MASGVEIRMPFLDWRLVAFTFSLPWTSKLGGGFTKRIMRDALKGILPEEIRLRRDKIGWNAPVHNWFLGPLKGEVDKLATEQGYASSIGIAWKRFKRLENPCYQDGEKMWLLLLPYFWRKSLKDAKHFGVRTLKAD